MRDRVPARLDRLPRERASGGVGDRDRGDDRQPHAAIVEKLFNGEERCFEIQRVEGCLRQKDVHAAIYQAAHLLVVRGDQLIERGSAERRIVDVGGERGGAVRRADRSGHETRLLRRRVIIDRLSRQARRSEVHIVDLRLQPIVGHGDRLRVERVRLDDVGAGLEVGPMDLFDHLRLGQRKEIVRPFEIARMIGKLRAAIRALVQPVALDHRSHRAIEDQNALLQGVEKFAHKTKTPRLRGRRLRELLPAL